VYVAAFLDDHSRYLVSLSMAHHQRSTLVLEALARGIADYGAPREILTDQGRQYTAWRGLMEFEAELHRANGSEVSNRSGTSLILPAQMKTLRYTAQAGR
jgi:hypothetical protein